MVATSDPGAVAPAFQAAASWNQSTLRTRFYVEMNPGETTCVSWRKLMKDFLRTNPGHSEPPLGAHPALQARIAPDVVLQKDPLPPPANRFNSVIEKIEKIYKGEDSADEDDMLNDFPDDDQYDTEDSFIDDRELNEYFSVDKEKLKHEGFFINRGKLERENEPVSLPVTAPKKRKRRDVKKLGLESDGSLSKQKSHKGMRLEAPVQNNFLLVAGLSDSSDKDAFVSSSQIRSAKFVKNDSQEFPRRHEINNVNDKVKDRKRNRHVFKSISAERLKDHASIMNKGDVKSTKELDETTSATGSIYKESGLKDVGVLVPYQPPKVLQESSREDNCKEPMTVTGGMQLGNLILSSTVIKDVSPVRSKSTALERAIQDLERVVGQLFPPSSTIGEAEPGKRNRLPQDIKQKLAKIARLAAKQGKLTDGLINRLMDILGHVMRVKTLKRNLKEMIEIGLSDMREKEGRLQDIKREVTEMVKSRVHSLQTQDVEQQDLSSDDFEMHGLNSEKASTGGRYKWDNATEDKICDLYEQYLEGMDEHKGPQIRKLYGELAELWPNGWMDNNGIKNAVQRAKERKKKLIKATKAGLDIKRRQRHSGKQMEADVERFPLLDLNLPGTDHSPYDKAKCNTAPETNLGNQLPSSSGVSNHHLFKKSNVKNHTCMEQKKIEGNPLLKKKVKWQLERSVMNALGTASHGKSMTFEAPYWKMGIPPLVSLPTVSLQQHEHLSQSETPASDHTY